ncbi:MAG: hypothetical protein PF545_04010 [Elusimicrobia bacterium]|jgi:hypothetical protein|nr:hypothetical protein [Elusimicrobiota bacterium]
MIKKILVSLAIILSGLSFYIIVGKFNVEPLVWLWISFAPYMLIAALAIVIKNRLLQIVFVPSLLFYGAGTLLAVPIEFKYSYAHISAVVMIVMSVYIIFTQLIRLRVLRIFFGLLGGIILFLAVQVVRPKFVGKEDVDNISYRENTLLYNINSK